MKLCWTLILLFLLSLNCMSADNGTPDLRQTMNKLGMTMKDFYPYLFSSQKFADPNNAKIVNEKINTLTQLFRKIGPHFEQKPLTYKISYQVMLDHLETAKKIYKEENKQFARTMLKDVSSICVSCHNQDKIEKGFFMNVARLDFASDYEYGEFSYMTRNYLKALKYFDSYLTGPDALNIEANTWVALRRVLTIFVQVEKDPAGAINFYQKVLQKNNLPQMMKNDVTDWIVGLKDWKAHDDLAMTNVDWKNLEPLVKKHLVPMSKGGSYVIDGKKQILYLRLASYLYDYLQTGPTEQEIPHVLYWLAVSDRILNYDFFFSLADLYLKECIQHYSTNEIAPTCYNEYKEYINFAFTGSKSSEIPEDIKLELKTLKAKLKGTLIKNRIKNKKKETI